MYNVYSKNNTQLASVEEHVVSIFNKILDLINDARQFHQQEKMDECFQRIHLASQLCVEMGNILSDNDQIVTLDGGKSLSLREFWSYFFEDMILTMGKIKYHFDDTIYQQLIETITLITHQWSGVT